MVSIILSFDVARFFQLIPFKFLSLSFTFFMFKYILFSLLSLSIFANAQTNQDDVLGRWITTDSKAAVNIYKYGNNFRAKVIWFDDKSGSGKPMNSRTDEDNPDASLRNRKIIGMDILEGLSYNSQTKRWENGKIYDASSGRTWDAYLEIQNNGELRVRGYWKFKWIGKTIHFRRF